jgi:hypothetical protein
MGFDFVDVYGPENLEKEFVQKTSPYIFHRRGAGYWLWKPYFLKKKMDLMNEGDYLIYADAGCHVNIYGQKRLKDYFDILDSHESGVLSLEMSCFSEETYTNEKVFEFFEIEEKNDSIRKTGIYVGGILFFKKNKVSVDLIDKFYEVAINNPVIFSDEYNSFKRKEVFVDHRHDQSVFSVLRKLSVVATIPDETFSQNWKELLHVPILATRIRN